MGAACDYQYSLAEIINAKKATGASVSTFAEEKLLAEASELTSAMLERLEKLEADVAKGETIEDAFELAKYHREVIFADMGSLREIIDQVEVLVPSDIWPYPTYGEMLYSVK